MANSDNARGFQPVKYLDGRPYTGFVKKYFVPATDTTALYKGDPVKLAGSSDSTGVYPTVTRATTGDAVVGVVMSVDAATREEAQYSPASTADYVFCAPVENLLFEIQEDSDSANLAATSVGLNASYVGTGGGTTYGFSSVELDSDSAATTATLALQIIGLAERDDNAIGTNGKWLVRFNDNQYINQTQGV